MKSVKSVDYELDSVDKQIIHLLMGNSKSSLALMSTTIGISTTAIHQRIKKLENAGVIENSISVINPRNIGYKVIAYIGLHLSQSNLYEDMIKALESVNEVVEAHYTTGNYAVFVKVLCRDNDHLMSLLSEIQNLKGVMRTETFISLEQSIERQLKV